VGDDESALPGAFEKTGAAGCHFSDPRAQRPPGDLLSLAKQFRPKLVATFETCLWLASKGFEKEILPMNKGGAQRVGEFDVTMTHAMHSNSIEDDGGEFMAANLPVTSCGFPAA